MKYAPLRFELKRQFPGYEVTQYNITENVLGVASMNTAKNPYVQPRSKRLGTLEEIRHKDALC